MPQYNAIKIVRYNIEVLGINETDLDNIVSVIRLQPDARFIDLVKDGEHSIVVATNLNEITYERIQKYVESTG